MHRLPSIAAASLVLLVGTALGDTAFGCEGEAKALSSEGIDLGWIDSDLTLFGVDDRGLYEARLDSTKRKLLARTRSKFSDGLMMSPDGRFLLYSTSRDEFRHGKVNHLFDRKSGVDRVVPVLPVPEDIDQLEFIGFSPDGRQMVWQDNRSYSAWDESGSSKPALIVFDTESLDRKEYSYPSLGNSSGPQRSCFTSQWGPDGRSIYSNYLDSRYACAVEATDRHLISYFKTDIHTGKATRVDGGYSFDEKQHVFNHFYQDGGETLRLAYPCKGGHGCTGYHGRRLVAGSSQAWLQHIDSPGGVIDGKEELFVQGGGRPPRKIDSGWTSSCAGTDIETIAWIENGGYLLYRREGNTYIYGVAEDKTSPLPQLTGHYNWLPLEAGGFIYSEGSGRDKPDSPMRYSPSHAP